MDRHLNRRTFLKSTGMAAGMTLALPGMRSLSWVVPTWIIPTSCDPDGLFLAQAMPVFPLVLSLLGAGVSVSQILSFLGVNPALASPRPDYADAGGCTENFQEQASEMRTRDITRYSGVQRAPINRNLAVLAGENPYVAGHNELAVQYEGAPAVNLRGRDPDVIRAAAVSLQQGKQLSPAQFASAIAVTNKKDIRVQYPSGTVVPAYYFDTALGGYIIDSPWHPNFTQGAVSIQSHKKDTPALVGLGTRRA